MLVEVDQRDGGNPASGIQDPGLRLGLPELMVFEVLGLNLRNTALPEDQRPEYRGHFRSPDLADPKIFDR